MPSDNLAHQLEPLGRAPIFPRFQSPEAGGNDFVSGAADMADAAGQNATDQSQELALNRIHQQNQFRQEQESQAAEETAENSTEENANQNRGASGASAQTATAVTKQASRASLTTFWGSVWADWTLLSLFYLNGHLVASIFLPQTVCEFGEDYLFGQWLPKDLAKYVEIILLGVIDGLILVFIIAILYIGYNFYELGFIGKLQIGWNLFTGDTAGIVNVLAPAK